MFVLPAALIPEPVSLRLEQKLKAFLFMFLKDNIYTRLYTKN